MFSSTILLIVLLCILCANKAYTQNENWYKHAVFYQIYPRSFRDSNNDGIGDLKGITTRLDHLKDLGVDGFWLCPIFKSPGVDAGYDVSDYRNISSEYGTMEDFEQLISRAKELGLKMILDFVPNHSSDQHEWFKKSEAREPGYEDYYVWFEGKNNNTDPPNNWISAMDHGPAWTFSEQRQEWYLHHFTKFQPDLNYRDPKLVQEMKDVLVYWLDKGVDGFRVDAISQLVEDISFADEPLSHDPNATPGDAGYLIHIYTMDQPGTFDMVYQWRELLDEYTRNNEGDTRVMMTESTNDMPTVMSYYGNGTHEGGHFPFNFLFIFDLNINSTARDIKFTIDKWLTYMPTNYTPNWVMGNHDRHRVATKFGVERINGMEMIQMFLPGVAVTYNGEEIGMEDGEITWEDAQDPIACNGRPEDLEINSRDYERTPYQWDDSVNAGFNDGAKPWLPVSEKYLETNLVAQKKPEIRSHYKVYKSLVEIRKNDILKYGEFSSKAISDSVLLLTKEIRGQGVYALVANIGDQEETVNFNILSSIPAQLIVELTNVKSERQPGDTINSIGLILAPYETLLIKNA